MRVIEKIESTKRIILIFENQFTNFDDFIG